MRRDVQGVLVLLLGVTVLRLSVGDQFLFYVAEGMRTWLLLSAAILICLGLFALVDAWRSEQSPEADHGHEHGGPKVAYLLVLPMLAVYLIAPSALGSYSAQRQAVAAVAPSADIGVDPLPPGTNELPVRDFVTRAVWDSGRTLQDRDVRLTGFVTPNPDGGWWLTRMSMACCAADAQAARVQVLDAQDLPPDTWVTVTGRWVAGGGTQDPAAVPRLAAVDVLQVSQPRNPYE